LWHDTRIVDQHVDITVCCFESLAPESIDRVNIGKISAQKSDLPIACEARCLFCPSAIIAVMGDKACPSIDNSMCCRRSNTF
jgi:hypothetical protein